MAIETELKLRIAPEHMARLKRHPFLRTLSVERGLTRQLYSVYFDTPDLRLHHERMALRLRRVGKQWLQTLKGGGGVRAGLHQRNEWETPVDGERLDFAALEAAGASALPPRLRKQVQPLFVTDFTRNVRMLQFEGAVIELSLDSGEIRAGKRSHIISELELELKSGEPLQLYRLALALLDIVPLEIEATSKAEYGYRLHQPVATKVSKAQLPKLVSSISLGDALQSMVWSCLFHLQANVSGVVNKADDEYLHQVRVALRRLRVVLGMTRKYRADAELESLRGLVAELGTTLGHAREWDVFVTQVLPGLRQDMRQDELLSTVIRRSETQRKQAHQRVQAILQGGDFQRLLLRFGAWMYGEYWHDSVVRDDLSRFAATVMHRRSRKLGRYGEHIVGDTDAQELHRLRIACKNLRYSTDLFAPLYAAEQTSTYLKALAKLQDTLGVFNDHAVALRLLEALKLGEAHATLIRKRILQGDAQRLALLRKAWKKLIEHPDFW